ncbi:MAG: hypothetical protein K6F05_09140, partial [Succinivibrio sp.]|nr:hypothetical protein [Succinivibrio sp.]
MTNEHAREQLREKLKKSRQQLENRAQLERQAMTRLLEHPYLKEPRLIASYQSLPDELNTWQLNEQLLKSGHTLSLPVMLPGHKGKMNFYKVSSLAELKVNSYGISEPLALEELKL